MSDADSAAISAFRTCIQLYPDLILNNGFLIAIVAHALIGVSLIWDKVLLRRPQTNDVVNYVFWLGAMSVLGLCLIPFGFRVPPLSVAILAFGAGVIHLIANYFYYATLQSGDASQTLAIMGGFSPLATFLFGLFLLHRPFSGFSGWGFGLMVAGGFLMFFSEPVNVKRILVLTLLAAITFGLTNVLQKSAFDQSNFVTAYVFFTIGTFTGALFFLIKSSWRARIFRRSEEASTKSKSWYFVNRFISGVGSFLIFFAISRAHPAIVAAIAGLRYVIIFLGAFLITKYYPRWLKEDFGGWALISKSVATALIAAGLVLVGLRGGAASSG
ncbi:MAG: EamA family transporter [Bryobacteraceae bacterium]